MIPSKVLGSKIHTMVVQLHYFFCFFFKSIFPFCLAKHLQISFVPNALYDVIYLLLDESNLYVRKITLHENHSGFLYIFFLFLFSLVFFFSGHLNNIIPVSEHYIFIQIVFTGRVCRVTHHLFFLIRSTWRFTTNGLDIITTKLWKDALLRPDPWFIARSMFSLPCLIIKSSLMNILYDLGI